MKKTCSSVSIEHLYILFLVILVIILISYIYMRHHHHHSLNTSHHNAHHGASHHSNNNTSEIIIKEQIVPFGLPTRTSLPLPLMGDVLLNPYQPPLRDDRYFPIGLGGCAGGVLPINVPTQSVNTSYRQVGILTRGDTILPLMGKPLFSNRDKWNFYTMNDKNNMIKLPLSNKGKSCTSEFGCDNIYNGDTVYVEGYNDAFKATVYDNQVMQYIPFL
jgi:hypothetical protein